MWPWSKPAPAPEPPSPSVEARLHSLEVNLSSLEESVLYLQGSLRKLRGKIYGGLRSNPDPGEGERDRVSDAPPLSVPSGIERQWDLASLARTRAEEMGRAMKGGG